MTRSRYDSSALDALPGIATPGPDWRRLAMWGGVAFVAMLFAAAVVVRNVLAPPGRGPELVEPLNPDVQTAAIFVGPFVGLFAASAVWLMWRHDDDDERGVVELVAGVGTALVLCIAASTWCARRAVASAAFAGLHPAPSATAFTVIGRNNDEDGAAWLRLRAGDHGREFGYAVDRAVYGAAQAGQTVMLPVETGRWHVRRTRPGPVLRIGDLRRR